MKYLLAGLLLLGAVSAPTYACDCGKNKTVEGCDKKDCGCEKGCKDAKKSGKKKDVKTTNPAPAETK